MKPRNSLSLQLAYTVGAGCWLIPALLVYLSTHHKFPDAPWYSIALKCLMTSVFVVFFISRTLQVWLSPRTLYLPNESDYPSLARMHASATNMLYAGVWCAAVFTGVYWALDKMAVTHYFWILVTALPLLLVGPFGVFRLEMARIAEHFSRPEDIARMQ